MFTQDLEPITELFDEELDPDQADRIKAMIRPAAGFRRNHDDADTPSYRNGSPRMPASTPWPEAAGLTMTLLASIDLRTVPDIADWTTQPSSGVLLCFGFAPQVGTENVLPRPLTGSVIYVPDNDLPFLEPPAGTIEDGRVEGLSPMGLGWSTPYHGGAGGPDEVPYDIYDDYPDVHEYADDSCAVQLLGIARPLQENPLIREPYDPTVRLLVQVDTQDVFAHRWTIRDEELHQLNFATAHYDFVTD